MKFEKLTDNKIRILLSLEDMNTNKISAKTFFSDKDVSQDFLQSILTKAEEEIGFKTEDCKLLVEAILSSEGGFIFTITKLVPEENIDSNNSYRIFKFKSFDNFIDFCTYIKNMDYFDFNKITKDFSLFLHNNIYYLFVSDICDLSSYLLLTLTEFSESVLYSSYIDGFLNEYGKVIFDKNAICQCIKMIKE